MARSIKAERRNAQARQDALKDMRDRYPDEYATLHAAYKEEGFNSSHASQKAKSHLAKQYKEEYLERYYYHKDAAKPL